MSEANKETPLRTARRSPPSRARPEGRTGEGRAAAVSEPADAGPPRLVLPVPDLAGPTTVLRPWSAEDAPVLAAAWHDPLIRERLVVPEPAGEDTARRWIEQRSREWSEGRSVDLAVADRASGVVIGEVGLSRFDPVRRAALAGWWIDAAWRGQGRAGEAVRLVLDWVLVGGLLDAVMAEVRPDNPASAAVARRAGMRRVDTVQLGSGSTGDPAGLVFARTAHPG